jgi:hypothetical protein
MSEKAIKREAEKATRHVRKTAPARIVEILPEAKR